jgi:hypothetical protein
MSELQKKYNKLIADQRELQRQFQEQAQALFKETTTEFFNLNPGINAVKWEQMVPYFNDGDECVFSVHTPTFTNATGEDLESVMFYGEYDGDNDDIWAVDNMKYVLNSGRDYYESDKRKILAGPAVDVESCDLFSSMIQSSEFEPVLQQMFGSHARVTITRDGIDAEEYFNHD